MQLGLGLGLQHSGVYSPFTPSDLNPKYYFDFTDAETVTTISGKISEILSKGSVPNISLTQATADSRPSYVDNSYALMDGIDDFLIKDTDDIVQPVTIVLIVQPVFDKTNYAIQYLYRATSGTFWIYTDALTSNNRYSMRASTTFRQVTGFPSVDSPVCFTGVFNGSNSKLSVNGDTLSGDVGTNPFTGISLGGGDSAAPMKGKMFEAIFFDRILSDKEIIKIEKYVQVL